MKKFKKIEKNEWVVFDKVLNKVEGELIRTGIKESKFGMQSFIVLRADEGRLLNVGISAGLINIDWDNLIGNYILIEYMGEKLNEKTGRRFKDFEVSIAEII